MADAVWSNNADPDNRWGAGNPIRPAGTDETAVRSGTRGGRRRRPPGEPAPASLSIDAYAGSPWGPDTVAGVRIPARPAPSPPNETPLAAAPAWTPPTPGERALADTTTDAGPSAGTWSTWSRTAARRTRATAAQVEQRGLPGWAALLVQILVTGAGLLIDELRGVQLGTWFNVGIIAGAVLSILLVRRSGMFPVVVAPPIVYSLTAGATLYVRSGELSDHNVLIDAAANWLVYGFPAIAAATAAVLIIAGIRLITRH